MKCRIVLILALAGLIQACSSAPRYVPLTEENKASIQDVELYNLVIQDEIKPLVKVSNVSAAGAAGGLIGAVITTSIDSSINKDRSKSAQSIMKPLYDAIEDLDYRKIVQNNFVPTLNKGMNIKNNSNRAEAILLSNNTLKKKVNALEKNQALLYLSSHYLFTNGSKNIVTETQAFLFNKPTKKSTRLPKPIYRNSIYYESPTVGSGDRDSIKQWSENDGALFEKTIRKGIEHVSEYLLYDIDTNLDESCKKHITTHYSNILTPDVKVYGDLLHKDKVNKRITFRAKSGIIMSVNRKYKLAKSKKSSSDKACS